MALAWTDQSKDKCVRSQAITMAYDSDVFRNKDTHSTIRSKHKSRKNSIFNFKHSLLFIFLFFKNFPVGLLWLLAELTCVTLTSKNAGTLRDQNPPTLMSNRASGLVFADLKSTRCRCQVVEIVALILHSYKLYWLQMLTVLEFHHVCATKLLLLYFWGLWYILVINFYSFSLQGEFMQMGSREDPGERFSHYLVKTFKKTASLLAYGCKSVSTAVVCFDVFVVVNNSSKSVNIALNILSINLFKTNFVPVSCVPS